MAIRYAVADGNWSNTATWDGGTLPGASDDVWSNGYNVTIDQDITVLSLQNNTTNSRSSSASKQFLISGSSTRIINADLIGESNANGAGYVLTLTTANNGLNLTINGDVVGNGVSSGYRVLYSTSISDLNLTVNGDIYEGQYTAPAIEMTTVAGTGRSQLTVNGNITYQDLTASNTGSIGGGIKLNGVSFDLDFTGSIHNLSSSATTGTVYNYAINVLADSVINIDLGTDILRAFSKGSKARINCSGSQQTVTITAGELVASTTNKVLELGGTSTSQCTYIINADLKSEGVTSSAVFIDNLNTDTASLLTINGDIYRCSSVTTALTYYTLDTSCPTVINGDIKAGGYSTAIHARYDKAFAVYGTLYGQGGNTSAKGVVFSAAKALIPYFGRVECGTLANLYPIIDQHTTNAGIIISHYIQGFPAIQITDGKLHYMSNGTYTYHTVAGVPVPLTTESAGLQPLESKVLAGTSYGVGKTGTLTLPLAATVLAAIEYGEDGNSLTGTLSSGGGGGSVIL